MYFLLKTMYLINSTFGREVMMKCHADEMTLPFYRRSSDQQKGQDDGDALSE